MSVSIQQDAALFPPAFGRNRVIFFPKQKEFSMIVTTGNEVEGCTITSYLGIVRGIVVRSPSISQGFFGGLKHSSAGISSRMPRFAKRHRRCLSTNGRARSERGEDAVIAMRYDATEFGESVTEVLAYGTAVKVRRAE